MPWLTPDDFGDEVKCYRVFVPDNDKMRAAFRGALFDLSRSSNWEAQGDLTPEECAALFLKWELENSEMRPCMPAGAVFFFAGTSAPEGSLMCNGASYTKSQYPELYDAIKHTWGGSGSSFNVPDLRGEFFRAASAPGGLSVGDTGGANDHTLTVGEMPAHSHPLQATIVPTDPIGVAPTYGHSVVPLLQTESTGGGNSHNNMPHYSVLLPCITSR